MAVADSVSKPESGASLRELNSLRLSASAECLVRAQTLEEIRGGLEFAESKGWPVLVLGGGTNTVLAGDVTGLVLLVDLNGIGVVSENKRTVLLRVAAGEDWPKLVEMTLERGWWGLENLAMIPGRAGAAPMQNIGAYGVELAERLQAVTAFDRARAEVVEIPVDACDFGYRTSLFKHSDRYLILELLLQLERGVDYCCHTDYPSLAAQLWSRAVDPGRATPRQVYEAVCAARTAKLPDPQEHPNAGSFFKNPVVSEERALGLREVYPDMPQYQVEDGYRLAAGWMIERAGWRGHRRGALEVWHQQALVLVNRGEATGAQLLALAADIRDSVRKHFDVELEPEPRIIGGTL